MRCWVWAVSLWVAGCSSDDAPAALRDRSASQGSDRRVVVLPRGPGLSEERSGLRWRPAFSAPMHELRSRAQHRTGRPQPELAEALSARIPTSWSDDDARRWMAHVHDEVDWAVLRLAPVPSPEDISPTTPSFVDAQSYRSAATGIDVDGAQTLGFRGAGVSIHEVEYGWRGTHEDLVDVDLHPEAGQTVATAAFEMGLAPAHGTASVGMLIAPHNGYGIDGLVPDAALYTYPEWTQEEGLRRTEAIAAAVAHAQPGDIVMLQMQAQHP
ncbi:MAG: hypothetical protein KUG77_08720, partial [Nannocystaceae bacterium]|nr:hypothetical protein [Nannocystaceae bacterium]